MCCRKVESTMCSMQKKAIYNYERFSRLAGTHAVTKYKNETLIW